MSLSTATSLIPDWVSNPKRPVKSSITRYSLLAGMVILPWFLGGYYMISARDLNEAISVASKHPGAKVGTVELRALIELNGMPQTNTKSE